MREECPNSCGWVFDPNDQVFDEEDAFGPLALHEMTCPGPAPRTTWDKATPEQIRADLAEFAEVGRQRGMTTGPAKVHIGAAAARVIGWDPAADGQMVIGQTEAGGWVKVRRVELDLSGLDDEPPMDLGRWVSMSFESPAVLSRMVLRLLHPEYVELLDQVDAWEGEGGACG
jgi:hypothetical protein